MDALVRIALTLGLIWVVGMFVFEILSWLWGVFLEVMRAVLLGVATLLINLFVLLEKPLALWSLPHPAWSWALTGGAFGALLYFGCAEGYRLRHGWVLPATLMLALAWLFAPFTLDRLGWAPVPLAGTPSLRVEQRFGDRAMAARLDPGDRASETALALDADQRRWVQEWLRALGFDPGPLDGAFGAQTRAALAAYEGKAGLSGSGYLTPGLYQRLWVEGTRTLSERVSPGTIGKMVPIRGGCFQMGSPETEEGRNADERQHEVCLGDFYLAKHELTVEEFRRFVERTGYRTEAEHSGEGAGGCTTFDFDDESKAVNLRSWANWRSPTPGGQSQGTHPVACVSWNDAMAYVDWLNANTGGGFRLPTEAEWEYAARAGSQSPWYWGGRAGSSCRYANLSDQTRLQRWSYSNGEECTDGHFFGAPVGSLEPNRWDLFDMAGNVSEWSCSIYVEAYQGEESRCRVGEEGIRRTVRGGAFASGINSLRSAYRRHGEPGERLATLGFRLALPASSAPVASSGTPAAVVARSGSAEPKAPERPEQGSKDPAMPGIVVRGGTSGAPETPQPPERELPVQDAARGSVASSDIEIKAPDIAENGAVVPVTVEVNQEKIRRIEIYAGDLSRLAVTVELSSHATPWISTRIKLAGTGPVIAIATATDGLRLRAEKQVRVTVGARPGKEPAAGLDIKVRGQNDTVKLLLTAAMGTNSYVSHLSLSSGQDWLVNVQLTPWVSNNPYFAFKSVRDVDGRFKVQAKLNTGGQITSSVP